MKPNESKLLEFLTDEELDIFTKEDIKAKISLPEKEFENALYNLIKSDLIKIIEKGKYCKYDFRNELVIGNFLAKDGGIAYWSAMSHHGLTEQIPNVVFVQTSKKKNDKVIFGIQYRFVQVKKEKLTGYKVEGYGNHQYRVTDIEKTIADCFDLPQHAGGYNETIKAFFKASLSARKLVKYCKVLNNISIVKRMAYLSELLNKDDMEYFLKYALTIRNEKYNLFNPHGPKKGKANCRWKLIINADPEEIISIAKS